MVMRLYQKDIKTLKLLYSHADDTNNDFWRKGSGNNRYVDATCFVSENYYADKKWRVPNQREMSIMVLIDTDLIKGTYCRTKFSNMKFRKSWTYTSVFTMNDHWNTVGSIRCIKVKK